MDISPYVQLHFRTAEEGRNVETLDDIMPRKEDDDGIIRRREWKDIERSLGANIESVKDRIELIGTDGGRAFTVTFTDKLLRTFKPAFLYQSVIQQIKKTRGVVDFEFVGEYSDIGRYHMHGVISVKEVKVLATLNRKLRKYGILKIKMVTNTVGWAEYCTKQLMPKEEVRIIQNTKADE